MKQNQTQSVYDFIQRNGAVCVHTVRVNINLPLKRIQQIINRLKRLGRLRTVKRDSCRRMGRPHNFYGVTKADTRTFIKMVSGKPKHTKSNGVLLSKHFKTVTCPSCGEKLLIKEVK